MVALDPPSKPNRPELDFIPSGSWSRERRNKTKRHKNHHQTQTSHHCTHHRKPPQAPHEYKKKINRDPSTTEPTARNHHTHCKNQHKPCTHCTNQIKPINHCTHRTNQCKYQPLPVTLSFEWAGGCETDRWEFESWEAELRQTEKKNEQIIFYMKWE